MTGTLPLLLDQVDTIGKMLIVTDCDGNPIESGLFRNGLSARGSDRS